MGPQSIQRTMAQPGVDLRKDCLLPTKWGSKARRTPSSAGVGFVINPSGPFVQMAKEKHVAVLKLLQELEEGKAFSLKAIEKALGKIQWATATCPMAKPFLQPFWAWKSAVKTAGVPGKLVRCQFFSHNFSPNSFLRCLHSHHGHHGQVLVMLAQRKKVSPG